MIVDDHQAFQLISLGQGFGNTEEFSVGKKAALNVV